MTADPQRTRRLLQLYAYSLACLLTIALGAVLVYLDSSLNLQQVSSSIGLSLIASVIFAVIFAMLSNRIQERAAAESIEEGMKAASFELRQDLVRTNTLFLPSGSYPPLDPGASFGDRYNSDMMGSLEGSSYYAFRGPAGRYIAARLKSARSFPQEVRVSILSPGDHVLIARRAADRQSWVRYRSMTQAQLEDQLRTELILTIVSLFDYRRFCPVDLVYTEDTAVYRYEIFDDAVFVSWFHGPNSRGKEMPESFRFGASSFMYLTLRLDIARRFQLANNKIRFDSTHDDQFLVDHLSDLTGRPVSTDDVERWRAEYVSHTAGFTTYLDGLRGRSGR
ncbi:hypothetical protein CcI49_27220 [Frankia sp. CcI49]|uniref:hypothetical protein n=1 Tax=Frankia sp. CcI49 TaxID=1745382 RepID=UPI0009D55217|nr:hypothetical protein [Frankia sp. CcI49]ONH56163.1 hypothetical protein CcI49_27220 [Frankia sp. CcI49]